MLVKGRNLQVLMVKTGDNDICQIFSDKYDKLYNSVQLIYICEEYAAEFYIKFNSAKSKHMGI